MRKEAVHGSHHRRRRALVTNSGWLQREAPKVRVIAHEMAWLGLFEWLVRHDASLLICREADYLGPRLGSRILSSVVGRQVP